MALVLADRVKQTSSSLGTGSIIVGGSVVGYQTFAVIGNGNSTYYTIAGQGTSEWEVGIGTYTVAGTTLSRDTVLASSNGGAKVNFSAGVKDVFVTYPSERSVYTNSATNTLVASGNLPVTNLNSGTGASNTTFWRGDGTWAVPAGGGTIIGSGTANYVPKFVNPFEIGNSLIQDDGVGVGIGGTPNSSALLAVNGRAQATELEVYSAYPTLILTDTANGDNPYYIYQAGDTLIFQDNAAERMRIASGGAIGFDGANYGTSGQVLTSSGSGSSPTWTTPTYGTVTSVAALTLGTTGTDLSSTVANSTTTPVITLNVPTASATNRGALSSTDWTTFNSKVTSVSGTSGRITSTGGTTPILDLTSGIATAGTTGSSSLIPVVTVDTYGRVTSITTASNPQGTVTSVNGTGSVNGITLTGTVTSTGNLTLGGTLSNVSLATQVTGNLPVTNLNNGLSASAATFWRGDGTWATPIDTGITSISIASSNGLAGTSSGGTTPILTLSTTVTGLLKGNGTSISAATSGTDYAPATSGTSILYGNGTGGFSNVTIGSGVSFVGGTLSATGSGGTVTSVTGTSPIVSSGGTTPAISIPAATSTVSGYLTSTDWTTFNNKGSGSVTSVAALTLGTTGTDLSSTVANGTTTPVITLNVPTASATNRGALSSTDWTTFNNKVTSVSGTTGRITSTGGTTPVIDLASGVATAGTTGSSTLIPVVTIDTYGRVTSITTASNPQGTVTSVATSGSVNGITLTGGTITSSGTITLGGTLSGVSLTTQVTGTLPVGNGGTGAITLTGYVKGSGTSAFTASSTIPNTDITGLGTMSTQNASSVAITGGSINGTTIGAGTAAAGTFTNITLTTGTISTTPTSGTDIVNKSYADSISTGVNYHPSVQYASAATLTSTSGAYTYSNGTGGVGATITGPINTALIIDGHTMVAGDVTAGTRVLIKNETGAYVNTTTPSAAFNGAYVVTQIATVSVGWVLTRATDYDTSGIGTNEIDQGDFFYVVYGTANTNTSWIQQTALPITVGTTQITFVQFGAATFYTAGTGLTLSGSNQFSITNTGVTANTYGSASNVPVLTVNAQGQLTSVTNTPIAINVSAVTGAVTGVTATAPVVSSGGTAPVISMAAASGSTNGYLTSTDWTTFNSKGTGTVTAVSIVSANGFAGTSSGGATPALTLTTSVTGLLKGNGTAISAATSGTDYAPATSGSSILYGNSSGGFSNVTIGSGVSFVGGTLSATGSGGTVTSVTATSPVASTGGTTPVISMPAATSTVSGYLTSTDWNTFNSKGTVTSVTGTSPIVSSGGNTPAISIPAATSLAGGYLTSTDWSTFNSKVTSVTATSPVASTGGTTPVISMPAATTSVSGYLTSTDWNTFNNKGSGTVTSVTATSPVASSGGTTPAISLSSGYGDTQNPYASKTANYFLAAPNGIAGVPTFRSIVAADIPTLNQNTTGTASNVTGTVAIANGGTGATTAAAALTSLGAYPASNPNGYTSNTGTVTSVAALTLGTTGTDLSSTVANGTTTPVITLNVPTASATNRGALSAADWTTFNNKGSGNISGSGTTNYVPKWTGSSAIGNSGIYNDGSNNIGIGTTSPNAQFHVSGGGSGSVLGYAANALITQSDSYSWGLAIQNATAGSNYAILQYVADDGTIYYESGDGAGAYQTNLRYAPSLGGALDLFALSYIAFNTNGATEAVRITSTGNVGIGTTSVSSGYRLELQNGTSGTGIKVSNTGGGYATLEISSNATSVATLNFTNSLSLMGGNVGIGTSSPAKKLDVNGDALINGVTVGLGGGSISGNAVLGYAALYSNTAGAYNVAIGYQSLYSNTTANSNVAIGLQALYTNTTGYDNVGIGHSALFYNSGAYNVAIGREALFNATGSYNTGLGNNAGSALTTQNYCVVIGGNSGSGMTSQQILISDGAGTERMRIDSSGNVGIGTASPTTKLDVNGTTRFGATGADTITLRGQVSANSSVGTSGQVLTSQGANLPPQWTTPTSGTVTSVTATSPVASSGGTTPVISLPAATTSVSGYLTSTDWNTFNSKGSGTVTGTGTTNYLPKFTGTSAIGNSLIYDNGYAIGINTANPIAALTATISGCSGFFQKTVSSPQLTAVPVLPKNPTVCIVGDSASNENYNASLGLVTTGVATGSTRPSEIYLTSTRSTNAQLNASTFTPLLAGDSIGQIKFCGDNGVNLRQFGASINAIANTNWSSTNWDGYLMFSTTSTGGSVPAERMRIDSSGNVGIGTSSPAAKLHVVGAIYATGNITAYYSDDRLKTRKGNIENALDKVLSLDGFHYEANETAQALGYKAKPEVGLSAQQVQAVLPEVVVPAPIDDKYLTVHYERLIPLLVEAMKEQQAQIEELRATINLLRGDIR